MILDLSALPSEASAYFRAAEGLVPWEEVFTPAATVRDVDRDIHGRDAIVRWAHHEVDGGEYQLLSYQPEDGGVWMLVEFHPKDWDSFLAEYHFSFLGGKVQRAELRYSPEVPVVLRPIPLPVRRDWEGGQSLPGVLTRVVPRLGGLHLEFFVEGHGATSRDYWVSVTDHGPAAVP